MKPLMLHGHERAITKIKYNREGDLLFSASKDKKPNVWYSLNGERLGTFNGHNGSVWCIDVNWDTTRFMSGSGDNTLIIWDCQTDDAAAHYKNKSNFINIAYYKCDYRIEASWEFLVTSHGKSPCDGIGGNLEREAGRPSLQFPTNKLISTDLNECNIDALTNIQLICSSEKQHNKKARSLKSRLDEALTIIGTRSLGSFTPMSDNKIQCRLYSASTETFEFDLEKTNKRKS